MQIADEIKAYTCVRCPLGCRVELVFDSEGEVTEVSGHRCARGREYALAESSDPRRTVTSYVCAEGCLEPLSVKTVEPVPKHLTGDVLRAVAAFQPHLPIAAGDVLIENVCGSGIAVIATKSLSVR